MVATINEVFGCNVKGVHYNVAGKRPMESEVKSDASPNVRKVWGTHNSLTGDPGNETGTVVTGDYTCKHAFYVDNGERERLRGGGTPAESIVDNSTIVIRLDRGRNVTTVVMVHPSGNVDSP